MDYCRQTLQVYTPRQMQNNSPPSVAVAGLQSKPIQILDLVSADTCTVQ